MCCNVGYLASFDGVHILQALWKYIGPRPVGVCTKFRLPSIETSRSDCRSEHMRARLVKLLLCTRLRVRTAGDVQLSPRRRPKTRQDDPRRDFSATMLPKSTWCIDVYFRGLCVCAPPRKIPYRKCTLKPWCQGWTLVARRISGG